MEDKKYIYCFTNKINGKQYVGSTINNPQERYREHLYHATHATDKSNYPLYCAIRKYGLDNFNFEILEEKECSETEIRQLEQQYIIKHNCIAPLGYNQTVETVHPASDPIISAKISETKRNNARILAEYTLDYQIIQTWRSIMDCSESTGLSYRHIADCCRGERHSVENRLFAWLDKNGKLDIPIYTGPVYKGKVGTTQFQKTNRTVLKVDLLTNKVLAEYSSVALAARENNCDASGIAKVCRGKRNKCGGFDWYYKEEYHV